MKNIRRVAVLLCACLFILMFTSCRSNESKLYDEIYTYLNDSYKGVEFRINGYTQDIQTSGRYLFDVTCLTTNQDFEVLKYSLYISDSYYVSHANTQLRSEVYEILGDARELIRIQDVQCLNQYKSDDDSYRFADDTEMFSMSLTELSEIYRVTFEGVESSNDVAQCIYMFCEIMSRNGCNFKKISFDFQLNGESIRLVTNTEAILHLTTFKTLERLFEEAKSPSAVNNLFYKDPDSGVKIIPYPINQQ